MDLVVSQRHLLGPCRQRVFPGAEGRGEGWSGLMEEARESGNVAGGSLFDVLGHWVARLEKSVLFGCTCWNTWVCIVLPCLKEKKKKRTE